MAKQKQAIAASPAPPMQRSLFLATVKLAQQVGSDPATNGTRIVSTTIRQSNPQGEPLSVGEWSRQTIVQNSDWLVKIAKRDKDISKNGSGVVRITFGNGYEALVAIDCEEFPEEISEINKIGVVVCVSTVHDEDDTTRLKYRGVVNPSDSVFEHLQAYVEGGRNEQDIRIYIHTDVNPWTTLDESIERTEIYRVKTNRNDPFSVGNMEHLVPLEEQLQATGKVGTLLEGEEKPTAKNLSLKKTPVPAAPTAKPPSNAKKAPVTKAALSATIAAVAHDTSGEDSEHRFEFNPKDYIILSKAFHGKLAKNDITAIESKFTDKEVKKAERICKVAKTALKQDIKRRKMGDSSGEKATANAQSEAPKKVAKKDAAVTKADNDKAAKNPTMTNEKPASEASQENNSSKKKTPKGKNATQPIAEKSKDSKKSITPVKKAASKESAKLALNDEGPKVPAKETEHIEAPKEKDLKEKQTTTGVDEPKSPSKETKQVETPKKTTSTRKKRANFTEPKSSIKGAPKSSTKETQKVDEPKSPTKETQKVDEPKSPTKETQKVDVTKSPTKDTQKVETPKRKTRTTRSKSNADEAKSPAGEATLKATDDGAETETDGAETPKKKKSKQKHKDEAPSAAETLGPEGTHKKAAPEEKEQVETPVKRKSRKRKSSTLAEVPPENVATDTPKKRSGRPKGSTNKKPKVSGQDDGASPKKSKKR